MPSPTSFRAPPASLRNRAMRALLLALLTVPVAAPALAAGFTPPEGCTLEMTVQYRSCSVGQHYRCASDPEGDQHAAYFGREGLEHLSHIDRETRWLQSENPRLGLIDRIGEEPDAASFSTLTGTGFDDFDFWTESNWGDRLRFTGHDRLTGKKITVDGVELEETEFDLTMTDEGGNVLSTRRGNQFISRAHGRFYGGVEQTVEGGKTSTSNDSPVQFLFPGQAGFGDIKPKFDCEMQMVRFPLSTPIPSSDEAQS